jgi:hypothetical protein
MLSHNVSQMNLDKAAEDTLAAVQGYFNRTTFDWKGLVTRYGFYHSLTGESRAKKVHLLLSDPIVREDSTAIFAILLAIFGEPKQSFLGSIGRSSRLASYIANKWMEGSFIPNDSINTLESRIFLKDLLDQERSNSDHLSLGEVTISTAYLDKTKLARGLLQRVIEQDFKNEQSSIKKSADKLRAYFENNKEEKISFSFFLRVPERQSAQAKAATLAIFAKRQPEGVTNIIASFFSHSDTAKIMRLNKAAYTTAKETEEKQMRKEFNVYSR